MAKRKNPKPKPPTGSAQAREDKNVEMERFEEFGRRIFRVTKDDLKKVEVRDNEAVSETEDDRG